MKRRNFFSRLAAGLIAAPIVKKVIEEQPEKWEAPASNFVEESMYTEKTIIKHGHFGIVISPYGDATFAQHNNYFYSTEALPKDGVYMVGPAGHEEVIISHDDGVKVLQFRVHSVDEFIANKTKLKIPITHRPQTVAWTMTERDLLLVPSYREFLLDFGTL